MARRPESHVYGGLVFSDLQTDFSVVLFLEELGDTMCRDYAHQPTVIKRST